MAAQNAPELLGVGPARPVNAATRSSMAPGSRVGSPSASTSSGEGNGRVKSLSPVKSRAERRSSPTTASAGNGTPKTCSATSSMPGRPASLRPVRTPLSPDPLSPRVAEVATGQTDPRGRPGSASLVTEPRRRSGMATSVPCAPS